MNGVEKHQSLPARVLKIIASLAVVFALLFLPAGTLQWPLGWYFFFAMLFGIAISTIVVLRASPEIFETRSGFKPGTKSWDLVLVALLAVGLLLTLIVAGLDFRFGWSQVPLPVVLLGYAFVAGAFVLLAWAQSTNRFFEPGVRIQSERGHAVVDTGPYAHMRHPGYIGSSLLGAGMALALGSWWALLPAGFAIAVLVYRTLREEETLSAELAGYAQYTQRVRYRWVPGIW